jgi:acylphosphatase
MNKTLRITGKVQGVFFRKSTQQKAQELGINGWVKNENDGSVAVEIEGLDQALQVMEAWLKVGPTAAKVESVLLVSQQEDKGYTDFEIIR